MTVKVNGEARELPDGETLRALVARYKLSPEKVAIELNRRLARSEKYDQPLKEGDEYPAGLFICRQVWSNTRRPAEQRNVARLRLT